MDIRRLAMTRPATLAAVSTPALKPRPRAVSTPVPRSAPAARPRVGLNGFGRIGRALFRLNLQRQVGDIVAINDINPDAGNLAYLLRHDSLYGPADCAVQAGPGMLLVNGRPIALSHQADIARAPWQALDVDIVIDASGVAGNPRALAHGAGFGGHVVYTHAVADPALATTVIFGVNEGEFAPQRQRRVSSSICDTVALAPLLNLIDAHAGVLSGFLTTLHPWLANQHLHDGAALHGDYALGRAAVNNLIPKTTSALRATDIVLPGMAARIGAMSYRVPTSSVCGAVLNLALRRPLTLDQLDELLRRAERTQALPILRLCDEPLVSLDHCRSPYSLVLDQRWSALNGDGHLRLVYWYDNEWGYSSRVWDIVARIAAGLAAPGAI